MKVRKIEPTETPLLEEYLYQAIFIPPGAPPPPREVIFEPEIYIYIKDFGELPGDCGVVAERDGEIVGAAWTRIIPAYGHIDDDTPELAISVLPDYRGQNIGTMLMERLFDLLREHGYSRTSLSVQQNNPAVRFYKRLGYIITDEKLDHAGHEDYIMIKELGDKIMNQEIIKRAEEVIAGKESRGDGGYCVLALIDKEGYPTASTLSVSKADGIKQMTFCTGLESNKAIRIKDCSRASICFTSAEYNITLVGDIEIVTDSETKKEMWYNGLEYHFTGADDPNYCVLRFTTKRYSLFFVDMENEVVGII